MSLAKLPVEIITQFILLLDLKSITRCRQLSRLFRKTIDSTTAIQYIIELDASCVLQGAPQSLNKLERLQRLRSLNNAWYELRYTQRPPMIPIRNYASVYDLSGGLFVQDINDTFNLVPGPFPPPTSTISWMELPRRGIPFSPNPSWKARRYDFRVADLCLDVDRDLLIVVERVDALVQLPNGGLTVTVTCRLHINRLSSGQPHPDAEHPQIETSFNAESSDYAMIVQLSGNHIGLLLSTRHDRHARNDRFFLWDWTTSVCKGVSLDEAPTKGQWDTFCFLSHEAILIPDTASGCLDVFTFTEHSLSLRQVASLGLPRTHPRCPLVQITTRSEPPPHNPRTRRGGKNFVADPAAAIVVLTLDYLTGSLRLTEDIPPPQLLVTHRATLLAHARGHVKGAPVVVCEWDAWGPRGTRWGLDPVPARWVCYVHGQRYVSMSDRPVGDDRPMSIKVYDFNVFKASRTSPLLMMGNKLRRQELTGTCLQELRKDTDKIPAYVKEVSDVTLSSTIETTGLFVRPVTTSLPYRCVETKEVFNWDSVMMDDERIIGLKEELDELGLEALDVLVL